MSITVIITQVSYRSSVKLTRMYIHVGAASEVNVSKERLCGRVLHVQLHREGNRPRHALVVQGSLP